MGSGFDPERTRTAALECPLRRTYSSDREFSVFGWFYFVARTYCIFGQSLVVGGKLEWSPAGGSPHGDGLLRYDVLAVASHDPTSMHARP